MTNEDGDVTLGGPKVFERQGMLFGTSGEIRVGQVIKHVWQVPTLGDGQDVEEFVMRDLSTGLRAFLREQAEELLPTPGDDELWSLLVALRGRVFRICSHLSVTESASRYDAIGSGTAHALGSLASTEDRSPRGRVEIALRAAERHRGGVSAPFTVLEL